MNRPNIRRKPVSKPRSLSAPKAGSARSRCRADGYSFRPRYVVKGARP